jgi:hypothetical protein
MIRLHCSALADVANTARVAFVAVTWFAVEYTRDLTKDLGAAFVGFRIDRDNRRHPIVPPEHLTRPVLTDDRLRLLATGDPDAWQTTAPLLRRSR